MDSPEQADIPKNRVFAVIALALLMMSLDTTIVATALHAIQHGLDTSINLAAWTITVYSFGIVVMLPMSGKLSERFGRRRVFLGSTLVFTLASLGCGLAENIYVLIVLRALQAAGGAGFTPSATGIIVDHFGHSRDRYVSLFGSIFPIGAMIGPIFGGFFVAWSSWRDVFFVNVPIGLLILVFAARWIPHDRPDKPARSAQALDFAGFGWLGCSLLCGMLTASLMAEGHVGLNALLAVVTAGVAVVTGVLFFRHIRNSTTPLVAPRLIYGRGFGAVNLVNITFSGSIVGAMALVPLYAVNRYGISALGSGSLLTAQGVATLVCSLGAVILLRRTGYRLPLYVGSVLTVIGLALLGLAPPGAISPYFWLAFAAFFVGAGNGAINPAMRNAGLQLAPESSSMIAALRSLCQQIGSITTVSIITAILAASAHPGQTQAIIFLVLVLARLAVVPVIRHVPEQRGAW